MLASKLAKIAWISVLGLTLGSIGCGGDDSEPGKLSDSGLDAPADGKTEAGDGSKGDARADVQAPDASPDVTPTPEAGPDVVAEVGNDTGPDVQADAGPDAADAKLDVAPDSPLDSPIDTGLKDAAPDAPDSNGLCGDAQCSGSKAQCNTNSFVCVECLSNAHCAAGSNKVCETGTNTCVQCLGNSDCTNAATPVCNVPTHTCIAAVATLTTIEVTPTNPSAAKGTTLQLHATGKYSDNTTQDLTASATWSSGTTANVTIVSGGLASAVAIGTSVITATSGTISGTATLTVTSAVLSTLQVSPTTPSIAKGTQQQFAVVGTFSDNTTQTLTDQATWASSDTNIATVGDVVGSKGLAVGQAAGPATISASYGGKSSSTVLTVTAAAIVSVAVTPGNPTIARNTTKPFLATATYTDNSTQDVTAQATWVSSNVSVATVSNTAGSQGLATGVAAGTTSIQATVSGITGTSSLTVTGASLVSVGITPDAPSIPKGTVQSFVAIAAFSDNSTQDVTTLATWTSSNTAFATISNTAGSQGLATSVAVGTTNISVVFGAATAQTTLEITAATLDAIAVTPTNPTVAKGTTQQFTATGSYSDGSTQDLTAVVAWGTGDSTIATVSSAPGSQGLAKGVNTGTVSVTASLGAASGSTLLTVSTATLVSVSVTPTAPSIAKGTDLQFTATGTYSDQSTQDITSQVAWTSSDTAVSVVSAAGSAHGTSVGSANITATLAGKAGSSTLTVSPALLLSVAVTPASPTLAKGTFTQFTATGTYSDTTTQDLTAVANWSSSNSAWASVGNANGAQGLASAVNLGTVTITATYVGVSGSTDLTVTAATLSSIAITPNNPSIALGTDKQFTAIGTYSDQSTQDLTAQVLWGSATVATATISNSTHGLATSVATGTTVISATYPGGVSSSTVLTVTPATLVSIEVNPTNPSIAKGTTQQFTAIGHYSDLTTQTLTTQVTWASATSAVASISNAAGSAGLASGVGVGSSVISATLIGISGTSTLGVTAATLQSLAISPASPSVANGINVQFTVIGTYSDASTQDFDDGGDVGFGHALGSDDQQRWEQGAREHLESWDHDHLR